MALSMVEPRSHSREISSAISCPFVVMMVSILLEELPYMTSVSYTHLNVMELERHLGAKKAAEVVRSFGEAFIRSMPTGKQNTFANRTLPDAVYAVSYTHLDVYKRQGWHHHVWPDRGSGHQRLQQAVQHQPRREAHRGRGVRGLSLIHIYKAVGLCYNGSRKGGDSMQHHPLPEYPRPARCV